MSDDFSDDQLEFEEFDVNSVVAKSSYASAYLPAVDLTPALKPWHRPHKHYVRTRQWLKAVQSLLGDPASAALRSDSGVEPNKTVLKYLGLPGSDLIDLDMIQQECLRRDIQLRYLGFDDASRGSDADLAYLALNEEILKRRGGIHRESTIIPDNISELGLINSMARHAVGDNTFDVVNIDLCGSPLADPAGNARTIYSALSGVQSIQSARTRPWLLFITGAFDRRGSGPRQLENLRGLVEVFQSALEGCPIAQGEVHRVFGSDPLPKILEHEGCSESTHARLAVLSFVAWLAAISRGHGHSLHNLLSVLAYRTDESQEDPPMHSLAIRVTPKLAIPPDATGLLPNSPESDASATTCNEFCQFVKRTEKIVDVDQKLWDDDSLFNELVVEISALLEQRGYDVGSYQASPLSARLSYPSRSSGAV
ncbi:PP_RS20740 family protein [Arthrobacter sp. Ld5]|uniref:PP_RS20740 family protein n=1 Tax=Arthrobacter sp. Ld5 TaxID=649152 RepID=UPI003EBC926A